MVLKRQRTGVTHEWLDQRSLAPALEIRQMIREKPELLERAKSTPTRWIKQQQPTVPRALLEWQLILNTWSLEEIPVLITRDDKEARRLRRSSPFRGILPEERRLAIFEEYEARRI
jgi:hypothetical protein